VVGDDEEAMLTGSSSVRFSLFILRAGDLALDVRGQVESVDTTPHFAVTDS